MDMRADNGNEPAEIPAEPEELTPQQEIDRAYDIACAHVPKPNVKYDWVIEHARDQYRQADANSDKLDDKASAVINYLGAFVGASTLAAISQLVILGPWAACMMMPTIIFALAAISFAAAARRCRSSKAAPNAFSAVEYAEFYEEQAAKARMALKMWVAFVDVKHLCKRKADLVNRSTGLFIWAVWLLLLPCGYMVAAGFLAHKTPYIQQGVPSANPRFILSSYHECPPTLSPDPRNRALPPAQGAAEPRSLRQYRVASISCRQPSLPRHLLLQA